MTKKDENQAMSVVVFVITRLAMHVSLHCVMKHRNVIGHYTEMCFPGSRY